MITRSTEGRVIVRLFAGWGTSPLWLSVGELFYEESSLSPGLERDLRAWEQAHNDGLGADFDWVTPEAEREYIDAAVPLARRVAAELGPEFEIDASVEGVPAAERTVSSDAPATNPAARDALMDMVTTDDAARERAIREMREREVAGASDASDASGASGWFAYAPLSKATFDPDDGGAEGDGTEVETGDDDPGRGPNGERMPRG